MLPHEERGVYVCTHCTERPAISQTGDPWRVSARLCWRCMMHPEVRDRYQKAIQAAQARCDDRDGPVILPFPWQAR